MGARREGEIKVFFPKHKDPKEVLSFLDLKITQLAGARESLSKDEQVVIITSGLQDLDFWKQTIGDIIMFQL